MSAPIPSVPSATRSPSASTSALPTELFMFERVLCAIVVPDSTTMRSSEGERYTQCARRASFVNAPAFASLSATNIPNLASEST